MATWQRRTPIHPSWHPLRGTEPSRTTPISPLSLLIMESFGFDAGTAGFVDVEIKCHGEQGVCVYRYVEVYTERTLVLAEKMNEEGREDAMDKEVYRVPRGR